MSTRPSPVRDGRAEWSDPVPPEDEAALRGDWSTWRRPVPGPAALRRDAWLALGFAAAAVLTAFLINSMGAFPLGRPPTLVEQLGWVLALAIPLAWRRRFPATVAVTVAAVFIAAQARSIGDNLMPSIALFTAIYSLGAWGRDRAVARWVRVGIITAMFAWLVFNMVQTALDPVRDFPDAAGPLDPMLASILYGFGFNLMFFVGAYVFGNAAWLSACREHELELRAIQLRQSQDENARRAVVEERIRIARDLHDVVAHHVSVMGVQAAAARRVLDTDRDLARTALGTIEQTARTAVQELRGLLGVLRGTAHGRNERDGSANPAKVGHRSVPPPSRHSSPGLDQVAELVEEMRSPGLRVEYAVYGEPRPVPDAVALSAYRVVQEALTNTVKHAGASLADVRVRYLERAVEVEVTDDGRGVSATAVGAAGTGSGAGASGLGQIGMRERVAVHDGMLEIGPRAVGGYRVRAQFPIPELQAPPERSSA